MFKKAQLKFFFPIAGMLLAIIIAVLVSINVIMDALVQRQSKVVLKQIAESVEYDEESASFVYFEDSKPPDEPEDKNDEPVKPSEKSESTTTSVTTESTTETTTETASTYSQTEKNTSGGNTESDVTDTPQETNGPDEYEATTQPSATEAPEQSTTKAAQSTEAETPTTAPSEVQPTQPEQPTQAATDDNQTPWNPPPDDWGDPYGEDGGQYYDYEYSYPDTNDWERWYNFQSPEENIESEEATEAEPDTYYYDYSASSSELTLLSASANTKILNDYTVKSTKLAKSEKSDKDKSDLEKKDPEPLPKSLGSIDFFVLMADTEGSYLASFNNDDITEETAQSYIDNILSGDSTSGMLNKLQFYTMEKENGTLLVFTDKSSELDMLDQLTHTTILIGIISLVALSVLTLFISKKSIHPIKVAFEKQKQFISDASHELKTPLTIISANADVLSDEIGDNKWLKYIKSQTERMNVLVNDLLNLTRLENNTADFICSEFNLSKAIENTALPFECQAFELQKVFDIDIQDGLTVTGSERHIKQMAAIFIDNALKYSNEGGTVRVTLKAQGDKKILSVFNTGSGVHEDEKDKIFERFYRSDDSRARATGGYGLGLAIAKSIIDKHKFKITVDNVEGESICFNVIM